MLRLAGAVIGGLVAWMVLVTLLNFGVRAAIPGYHAAEPTFAFTLTMIGCLTIAVLTFLLTFAPLVWAGARLARTAVRGVRGGGGGCADIAVVGARSSVG